MKRNIKEAADTMPSSGRTKILLYCVTVKQNGLNTVQTSRTVNREPIRIPAAHV